MRVLAPGSGAGAVAGYGVLRVDPAIVDDRAGPSSPLAGGSPGAEDGLLARGASSNEVRVAGPDDLRVAFGE